MEIRFYLLIFLFSISLVAFSQKTKPVIVKFNDSKEIFARYSVLKSDKKIKHGEYIAYFKSTDFSRLSANDHGYFVRIKGNFSNGKKDGEWVEYSEPNILKSKGIYMNDKKVGIWETSKENGQVIERYDYSNKKYLTPELKVNINYPTSAAKKNIEGKVKIGYKIQPDCLITDVVVIESLSPDCDKAAIDAISRLGELSKKYRYPCEPGIQERAFKFSVQ